MKNLFIGLFITIFALTGCSKLDNYAAPEECLTGKLIDTTTGEPLITEQPNGFRIRYKEISWSENPQPEYIWGKPDGSFMHSKMFPGTYELTPVEGAFFPVEPKTVEIKGKVNVDFEVTPYMIVHIKSLERTSRETLRVEYTVSRPKVGDKIRDSRVFVSTNPNVSNNIFDGDKAPWEDLFHMTDEEALAGTYVQEIGGLNPNKTYYVRVGARTNNPSLRYNYTKVYELK